MLNKSINIALIFLLTTACLLLILHIVKERSKHPIDRATHSIIPEVKREVNKMGDSVTTSVVIQGSHEAETIVDSSKEMGRLKEIIKNYKKELEKANGSIVVLSQRLLITGSSRSVNVLSDSSLIKYEQKIDTLQPHRWMDAHIYRYTDSNEHIHIVATLAPDSFSYEVRAANMLDVTIYAENKGWFKSPELRVMVANTNPYISTTGIRSVSANRSSIKDKIVLGVGIGCLPLPGNLKIVPNIGIYYNLLRIR